MDVEIISSAAIIQDASPSKALTLAMSKAREVFTKDGARYFMPETFSVSHSLTQVSGGDWIASVLISAMARV